MQLIIAATLKKKRILMDNKFILGGYCKNQISDFLDRQSENKLGRFSRRPREKYLFR